jgi:hypothetical protein
LYGGRHGMAAVTKAVATGHIAPNEATEIGKVIDAYVTAYRTAELDRVARVEQLSDAELTRTRKVSMMRANNECRSSLSISDGLPTASFRCVLQNVGWSRGFSLHFA